MKKDIIIPVVENIFFAAVNEWSDDFRENIWNLYLINDSDFALETVIIVSKAHGIIDGEAKETSTLRHLFTKIEPVTAIKVELIEKNLLQLTNEFRLSYFMGNTLYDKKFVFPEATISEKNTEEVPILFVDGVIQR